MLLQSEIVNIFNDVLNQRARLRKGGLQATYHCPFCFDKNRITQKLELAIGGSSMGNFHCWRCNTKGKTFGSLLKKLNASKHFRDRLFKLTGEIKSVRNYESDPDYIGDVNLPEDFRPLSQPRQTPEYRNAMVYLRKRGVLKEDILRYNIGYCENGPYDQHIIIPSYDAEGKLNFFMGRRYYQTNGIIPHKKPHISMDIVGLELFVNYNEPINLCEGFFDAIAIRNNAVPLFGKFPSKKLREKMILNKVKRVNMILDSDAKHDAIKNCKMLMRLGIEVHLIKLSGKDPSVIGFEKIHSLINDSRPMDSNDFLDYELGL